MSVTKGVSVKQFFKQDPRGQNMSKVARDSGVAYSTLRRHVIYGKPVDPKSAERLERWSKQQISAVEALGLKTVYRHKK